MTPREQARALFERGTSIRDVARETGLSKGIAVKIRIELAAERAAAGLPPLPEGKPTGRPPKGESRSEPTRKITLRLLASQAEQIERRAAGCGESLSAYAARVLCAIS